MSLLDKLPSITDKSKKRRGRGYSSGKGGHTTGSGMKGQKSRQGGKIPLWFEGGQLPLIKRLPFWRGKGRFNVVEPTAEVTFRDIERMDSDVVSLETLIEEKIIDHRFRKAKIIATGTLTKKITVKDLPVSKQASEVIEELGGSVE